MTEAHHCAMALQIGEGRIDESGAKAVRGDQRAAGATAARKRLAQDGAREKGRCLGRLGVQRGKKQWSQKPFIKRAVAVDEFGDTDIPPRTQQAPHGQIVERMRARNAAPPRKNPPRHRPFVRTQHPTLA